MDGNAAYKIETERCEACESCATRKRASWQEEIIGGEVVMMSPPKSNHNRVKHNIAWIFESFLRGKRCEYLPDGEGLYLAEDADEYIPDGMIVCDPDKITEDGVFGAPDMVVEVLSPATAKYDRGRKKDIYEKYGVREYWIVNPADRIIEQYILTDGRFVLQEVYHKYSQHDLDRMKPEERKDVITEFKCSLFEDLTIRVDDVFDRVTIP